MCDFRQIDEIKLSNGKRIETKFKSIPWDAVAINTDKISGPGLYLIQGTGARYLYWTGKEWLQEFDQHAVESWLRYDTFKPGYIVTKYHWEDARSSFGGEPTVDISGFGVDEETENHWINFSDVEVEEDE
jgi:hypothetical protein